jgi:hypothetical protein
MQACCKIGDAKYKMLDTQSQTPTLSQEVFGGAGLPLSPVPGCITTQMSNNSIWADDLYTNHGPCNIFNCNCDHCYGERKRAKIMHTQGSIVCLSIKTRAKATAAALTNAPRPPTPLPTPPPPPFHTS